MKLSDLPGYARLVPLATFAAPVSGVVRLVTRNKRPVRIDGLGVSTA